MKAVEWKTIQDFHVGIEQYLVDGPKSMRQLVNYAGLHGATNFDSLRHLRALIQSERIVPTEVSGLQVETLFIGRKDGAK